MSGIVALTGDISSQYGHQMLARLTHRGPDGRETAVIGDSWLGRTWSVTDKADGGQPSSQNPNAAMVGNGAVSWGTYATAEATAEHGLVVTRDPLGIKPLYWAQVEGGYAFASELKAFPEPWQPMVRAFPPGHRWSRDRGLQPVAPGWSPDTGTDHATAAEPAEGDLARISDTLIRAVERRLAADVPVGVFLSGGLDSTLVGAIAAHHARRHGRTLPSFAIGVPGSSDLKAAEEAAQLLGTDHYVREVDPEELIEQLPHTVRSIESFDPMLVHSAVMNDLLSEFTSQHVKVVLSGEGSDELFAGYDHHRTFDDPLALHRELLAGLDGLHNLGLQRCDRVTMAHGLEVRVPFLDPDMVRTALSMPTVWKQPLDFADRPVPFSQRSEKWLLRAAFTDWLPDWLLWRRKEQFGDGTGSSDVLSDHAAEQMDQTSFQQIADTAPTVLRTPEEAYYYRLFTDVYPDVDTDDVVGRFAAA